jgi:hypothetical protein
VKEKSMKRACVALSGLLLIAVPVAAQPPAAGQSLTIAAAIQRGYNAVKMNLTQMADKVSDADYGFKLGTQSETRTFGQLFAHVAQSQFGTCAAVKGVPNPMMGRMLETELKTKAEFVKALNDSFTFCDDAYTSLTDQNATELIRQGQGQAARAAALANNVAHDNEMYGTGAAYLRSKNIVPPSTERQQAGRGGARGGGATPPPGR